MKKSFKLIKEWLNMTEIKNLTKIIILYWRKTSAVILELHITTRQAVFVRFNTFPDILHENELFTNKLM